MIARTTTIGIILSIFLWIFLYFKYKFIGAFQKQENLVKVVKTLSIYIILLLPVVIYLYNTNELFFANLRFGFEGFFSLVEEGAWNVKSNKMLVSQIVWPDNFKTWLIGDGYFDGPSNTDPYYVGPTMTGFYMWTDVGYLRFIFYFGLIGLAAFMFFFIKCGQVCAHKFRNYALLFWLLMLLNFIIWFKVSTDIFVVFALFLCISQEDNGAYENSISDSLDI
jgi:hypothetical protein